MDFFRRPQLVGKALQRLSSGSVRGDFRRSDPDGTSSVPYFPGVSTGQTLLVSIDGSPFTVTLTGATPNYQSILTDIDTAISSDGLAYDADGTIRIDSLTPGGTVEVTGGTAAAAIGFDISRSSFYSAGGDLPSAPEGRTGHPFGAVFPQLRENLSTESFNRAMARIAANVDVLYAEHMRQQGRMTKIAAADTSVAIPAAGTSLITLPSSTRVFTGLGVLPSVPTAAELAPYVQLIDAATGQPPATCRVVGIARGAVTGSPPYAAATTFGGAGAVSNVDIVKVSAAIEDITDGRVVQAPSGVDFTTNGTQVGDWAKITGATNTAPWSNNGYRWVVEQIVDARHLALRPMSQSEFTQANPAATVTDAQPILELQDAITGIEVYGTLEVRTGPFMSGVKVVVQPEIPANATYDVWICQPQSLRDLTSGADTDLPRYAANIAQLDTQPNAVLSGFRMSGSSSSRTLSAGFLRMHGRVLHIPATTYTPGGLGADGTYYVYFDETSATLKTATALPSSSQLGGDPTGTNTDPVIHPIASFTTASGAFTGTSTAGVMVRYETAILDRATVGSRGNFASLAEAATYLNAVAAGYGETSSTLAAYPHCELILLEDLTEIAAVTFDCPSLSVRGVHPNIALNLFGSTQLLLKDMYSFKMQDLVLSSDDETSALITVDAHSGGSNEGLEAHLRRVRHAGAYSNSHVVKGVNSGKLRRLQLDDCDFTVSTGITAVSSPIPSSATQEIYISRSAISTTSLAVTPSMFETQSGDWRGAKICIRDSLFTGWAPATGDALSLMVKTAVADSAQVIVQDVVFVPGTFAVSSDALLIDAASTTVVTIRDFRILGEMPRVVSTANAASVVDGLVASVRPEGSSAVAILCPTVRNCAITGILPDGGVHGILIQASNRAIGNTVTGLGHIGIYSTTDDALVAFCKVTLSSGSENAAAYGIRVDGARSRVVSCTASLTTSAGFDDYAAAIQVGGIGSVVEACHVTGAGAYAFVGPSTDTNNKLALLGCTLVNTTDSHSADRAIAMVCNGTLIDACRFETTTSLRSLYIDATAVEPEVEIVRCKFPTTVGTFLLSYDTAVMTGTGIKILDSEFRTLSSATDFSGVLRNVYAYGDVAVSDSAQLSHSTIEGNATVGANTADEIHLIDVYVGGNLIADSGTVGNLNLAGCTVAGTAALGGVVIRSRGCHFEDTSSFTCETLSSVDDMFDGICTVATATEFLQMTNALCMDDLVLATAASSMRALLSNVRVEGDLIAAKLLSLSLSQVAITGALTLGSSLFFVFDSVSVNGAVTVTEVSTFHVHEMSRCRFATTLSITPLTAAVQFGSKLSFQGLSVGTSCAISGYAQMQGVASSIGTTLTGAHATLWNLIGVVVGGLATIASTIVTLEMRDGTLTSGITSSCKTYLYDCAVSSTATLSANPKVSGCTFSNLVTGGATLVQLDDCNVSGTWVSTGGNHRLNNCHFAKVRTVAATPPNSVSLTSATTLIFEMVGCTFEDELKVVTTVAATVGRRFSARGCSFHSYNAFDAATRVHGLFLSGSWASVVVSEADVLIENSLNITRVPGYGINLSCTAILQLRLTDITVRATVLDTTIVPAGAGGSFAGYNFVWNAVKSGTLCGCTSEVPVNQLSGTTDIEYHQFEGGTPGVGARGISLSGCSFVRATYASLAVTGRAGEVSYSNNGTGGLEAVSSGAHDFLTGSCSMP